MSEPPSKYANSSLLALKNELRKRNLKVSGKKWDIVERLHFYDIHCGNNEEPDAEYFIRMPDLGLFKDLHAGISQNYPNVCRDRLTDYLSACEKGFDIKYEQLYAGRCIRYIRSCKYEDFTFVTAAVWAEMKKIVSYKVDLFVDGEGVIQECQCECAVGQGPSAHCKHVATTLYGVTQFCSTGEVLTEITCTQKLQTFHHGKAYRGSPVKTRSVSAILGKHGPQMYDPRTSKRPKYQLQADTRNIIINWQNKVSRLPVLQTFKPAKIRAINLDHHYLNISLEDKFLKEEKIAYISEDDISSIEHDTRNQNGSKRWHLERQKRITSSNFGTICKCTDRRNINTLVQNLLSPPCLTSKPVRHGKCYESIAVSKFEQVSDLKTEVCGLFVSKTHPMLAASPDRIIDDDTLVEIKCPFSAHDYDINETTVPYLIKHDNGYKLKSNHDYYYQVQGQLYCANRKCCKFVVYTFRDLVIVDIDRDSEFIDKMLNKLAQFYVDHFKCAVLKRHLYNN